MFALKITHLQVWGLFVVLLAPCTSGALRGHHHSYQAALHAVAVPEHVTCVQGKWSGGDGIDGIAPDSYACSSHPNLPLPTPILLSDHDP